MSFLKYINKKSIEKLMNSKEFKNWLYSKRWFGDKSQLSNLKFKISIEFFKFLSENISLTIIKIIDSEYEKQYFLPLAYFKDKNEILDLSENIFEITYTFIEENEKKSLSLVLLEAEFTNNFWNALFLNKDIYDNIPDLSIVYQNEDLKRKFSELSLNDIDNYNIELEQLGKGNTTNLIFKFTISSKKMAFNSYVFKSYRGFSKNLEPSTLKILASNQFLGIPNLNAKIEFKNRTIISLMDYIQNEGNIGEVYWNEINDMIYTISTNQDKSNLDFDNNSFLQDLIENKCSDSFAITDDIYEFFKKFHEAMILEDNDLYSSVVIEKDYFLRNFSQKLMLIIPEIIENKEKMPFFKVSEIESLFNKTSNRIQDICSSIEKSEIRLQAIHQDLHMEQILYSRKGKSFLFHMTDLEGDPSFSTEEKKGKFPKERDIASFLRSFSYIKYNTLLGIIIDKFSRKNYKISEEILHDLFFTDKLENYKKELNGLIKLLNIWETLHTERIIKNSEYDNKLINYFLIDRIIHEINYEIKFRPFKVIIPLLGLKEYLNE
ncbi:MAG: hypothetical protein KGD63_06820 [Candidatus Lokiarchaeota archaeon]|nr:hypothetical protein [Candidatus Lokiarchaeota archaeon]